MKRKFDSNSNSSNSSSSSNSRISNSSSKLQEFYEQNNIKGLDSIVFEYSNDCDSTGAFALKDYSKDDILLEIPLSSLFSLKKVSNAINIDRLRLASLSYDNSSRILTTELFIYLEMIHQYNTIDSQFYWYFKSLNPIAPTMLLWKEGSEAKGTNLYSSILEIDETIKNYVTFLDHARQWNKLQDDNDYNDATSWLEHANYDSLLWARSHYLSRRYPDFAKSYIDKNDNDEREIGLGNVGNLVPVLDLLNHDHNDKWLRLEVHDDKLLVIINVDRSKGDELFSNYGNLSNEELLYAYAFSIENNINDKVTVKLKSNDNNNNNNNNIFYITRDGIPIDLWKRLSAMVVYDDNRQTTETEMINIDTCEILLEFLEQKLLTLNISNDDNDDDDNDNDNQKITLQSRYINNYKQGQFEILTNTIESLLNTIEGIDVAEDEGIDDNSN